MKVLSKSIKRVLRPFYVPVANLHYKIFKAPRRYHHLFDEIERIKAARILEVGTWNGKRAVQMIEKAQAVSQRKVQYIGFDLFEDLTDELYVHELSKRPSSLDEVRALLSKTGAGVTLVQGNTLETLPRFVEDAEPVDFVFIDGGHNVDTIQSDWDAIKKIMHEHTVVIFDDYWRNRADQSAKPVVDNIDRTEFSVEILPEVDVFTNKEFGRKEISFAKVQKRNNVMALYQ